MMIDVDAMLYKRHVLAGVLVAFVSRQQKPDQITQMPWLFWVLANLI